MDSYDFEVTLEKLFLILEKLFLTLEKLFLTLVVVEKPQLMDDESQL